MADETRFTVAIHLGNDAMRTPPDVARALRKIAARLELEQPTGVHETIHDDNGNDVGRWKLGYADRPGYDPPTDD